MARSFAIWPENGKRPITCVLCAPMRPRPGGRLTQQTKALAALDHPAGPARDRVCLPGPLRPAPRRRSNDEVSPGLYWEWLPGRNNWQRAPFASTHEMAAMRTERSFQHAICGGRDRFGRNRHCSFGRKAERAKLADPSVVGLMPTIAKR
jgi:hypothetical protein